MIKQKNPTFSVDWVVSPRICLHARLPDILPSFSSVDTAFFGDKNSTDSAKDLRTILFFSSWDNPYCN